MTEQDIVLMNQELLAAIDEAPNGPLTKTAAAGTNMIRRRVTEAGFARSILPFKPAGQAVTRLPENDNPVIIENMEPDSPGAKACSFADSPDTVSYHGDTFIVFFYKITTPEFVKNIHQLATYKGVDLREVVTDQSLRSVHTQEDVGFIAQIDNILGSDDGVGLAGVAQNFCVGAGISRDNYALQQSYLEDRELMNGVWLMNRTTSKVFQTWDRTAIGGDLAERIFEDGAGALTKGKIMGIPHLFTMKKALVPNETVYQFAEPDYLGRAYVLQDLTLYVEKRKDIITFSAMEKIGITIANVAAVNKVAFSVSSLTGKNQGYA